MSTGQSVLGEGAVIRLHLPSDDGGVEVVAAKHVGESRFRVHNIPFFSSACRFLDIVEARQIPGRISWELVRVVEQKGNWTIFILSTPTGSSRLRAELAQECTIERSIDVIAISVPPGKWDETKEFLKKGQQSRRWRILREGSPS